MAALDSGSGPNGITHMTKGLQDRSQPGYIIRPTTYAELFTTKTQKVSCSFHFFTKEIKHALNEA